jgi:hypothetical protein
MSWNCYVVEKKILAEHRQVRPGVTTQTVFVHEGREYLWQELKVGAMWYEDGVGIVVKLPGSLQGLEWRMNRPGTNGCVWNVVGGMPLVTATPSINFVGLYHGWVTNGVVTDDCEGRTFDDYGRDLSRTK